MIYSTIRLYPVEQATPLNLIAEVLLAWAGPDGAMLLGYDRNGDRLRKHWFASLSQLQVHVSETLEISPSLWIRLEGPAFLSTQTPKTLSSISQLIFNIYYRNAWSFLVASFRNKRVDDWSDGSPYLTFERLKAIIRTQVPVEVLHELAVPYVRNTLEKNPNSRVVAINVYNRLTWCGRKESRDAVKVIRAQLATQNHLASTFNV